MAAVTIGSGFGAQENKVFGAQENKTILNIFFLGATWYAAAAKSLQSSPTLCDPIDGSLPGSAIPGIFQSKVLEWGAIAFSGNMI